MSIASRRPLLVSYKPATLRLKRIINKLLSSMILQFRRLLTSRKTEASRNRKNVKLRSRKAFANITGY